MTKTFLLGVGAQKGGTTWLYQYLKRHPQAAMGPIKELNVWGTHFKPEMFSGGTETKLERLRDVIDRRIRMAKNGNPHLHPAKFLTLIDHVALEFDPDRYVPYFDRLAAGDGVRLVGDITPNYSGLEADQFREIRARIEGAGYALKVVFLMRDPVERAYSAMKMADRNAETQGKGKDPVPAHLRFREDAMRDWCQIRTRYERTIPALEAAFEPDQLYFEFFESFFNDAQLARLTAFLGIDTVDGRFDHIANASPSKARPTDDDIAAIRAFYDETYRFAMDRFGADRIRGLWRNA